jgi:hypothetical protein
MISMEKGGHLALMFDINADALGTCVRLSISTILKNRSIKGVSKMKKLFLLPCCWLRTSVSPQLFRSNRVIPNRPGGWAADSSGRLLSKRARLFKATCSIPSRLCSRLRQPSLSCSRLLPCSAGWSRQLVVMADHRWGCALHSPPGHLVHRLGDFPHPRECCPVVGDLWPGGCLQACRRIRTFSCVRRCAGRNQSSGENRYNALGTGSAIVAEPVQQMEILRQWIGAKINK